MSYKTSFQLFLKKGGQLISSHFLTLYLDLFHDQHVVPALVSGVINVAFAYYIRQLLFLKAFLNQLKWVFIGTNF